MIDDDVAVIAIKTADNKYIVIERGEHPARSCVISWSTPDEYGDARMLFDGQDIETESFMVFVGMLDTVDDSINKGVIFNDDVTVTEL